MADLIDTLNGLMATCLDSEEGFGKAAKGVHRENLRNRFTAIARQRADFAEELAAEVKQSGAEPAVSGHLSVLQHRGWRELETSIRPKDDAMFLAECQEGEENTLRHYEQALTRELPAAARSLLERQRLAVEGTLLELRLVERVRRAG